MEYTKGRWEKEGNKIRVYGRGTIAICPSPTDNEGVTEFVANAHLIAAAPELYEALLAFDEYTKTNYPANIRLKQIAVERMDAALAKVEGK